MHLLELVDAHLRINGRRVEFGVSKDLLDKADVCAALEEMRGACVPQQVASSLASHSSFDEQFFDPIAKAVSVHHFAVTADEEGPFSCVQ